MTIENSELNDSAALAASDASLTGATGDGAPSMDDLKRGFCDVSDPVTVPHYLPQNADDGENYVGDPLHRGGFLTRPEGWER